MSSPSSNTNYHRKVGAADFEAAIKEALDTYGSEIAEVLNETVSAVAEKTANDLKSTSPKRKGKYARGWTWQLSNGENRSSIISQIGSRYDSRGKNAVVYGKKPTYRLAHLLEHGHAKRNGGRVAARPHIESAEDRAIQEFWKELKEAIER